MTRFDCDNDGEGMPWELWEQVVSNALSGRRGQEALAAMERALLALPEPKLIRGHLACDGGVCAIGAFVAHRRAEREQENIASVIAAMSDLDCCCGHDRDSHGADGNCTGIWASVGGVGAKPCSCDRYEPESGDAYDTTQAGQAEGLSHAVAWHLAYLNDETFYAATPEERYDKILAFVRAALGGAAEETA